MSTFVSAKSALLGVAIALAIALLPVAVLYFLPEPVPAHRYMPAAATPAPKPVKPVVLPELKAVRPFADNQLPEIADLLKEDGQKPKALNLSLIDRPHDGVVRAVEDIHKIRPPQDQAFMRYLWFPTPQADTEALLTYALNTAVSHAKTTYRPVKVHETLYRIDLRMLCRSEADFKRLVNIWENRLPSLDFWFHTVREKEIVVNELKKVKRKEKKTVTENKPVTEYDRWGRLTQVQKAVTKEVEVEVEVEEQVPVKKKEFVTEFAIHTGLDKTLLLATLTQSNAPIYHGEDFMIKALTSIEEGLYFDFVNMPRDVEGKTDLQAFIDALGAETNDELRRENASFVGMFRSGVTNKPRKVEYFYGTKSRPAAGPLLVTITHDLSDEDVIDGRTNGRLHPIRNLLDFKGRAFEVIATRPNGTFIYALYDAAEKLIAEAPPNVARDNIPAPYPARLQCAISCIRCHASEDGRRTAANNVTTILKNNLDVFDDESSKDNVPQTLDLLASMYSGDLTYPLMVTRNAHSDVIFKMTKGSSVPQISASLGKLHIRYMYEPVTPSAVVRDLGYNVTNELDAVLLFNRLLPPLPPNRYGISSEDPIIGTLREWSPNNPVYISRLDWLPVLSDALLRVITNEVNIRIASGKAAHDNSRVVPGVVDSNKLQSKDANK